MAINRSARLRPAVCHGTERQVGPSGIFRPPRQRRHREPAAPARRAAGDAGQLRRIGRHPGGPHAHGQHSSMSRTHNFPTVLF